MAPFSNLFQWPQDDPSSLSIRPHQIPQVPIHQLPPHLSLTRVYEITLQRIIQIAHIHRLPLQQSPLAPPRLPAPLLVDEQPTPQLLGLDLQEAGQLLQIHGGVELQVGPDGGAEHGIPDLGHEDGGMMIDRIDIHGRMVEIGRGRGDEFRAGAAEQLLEQAQTLGPAALQADELVAVFFAEGGVDGIVELHGVEGDADGDEGVHLLVLLGDAVVLGVLLEVLGARHVHQDVAEHADGVGVAAQHQVGEADVVVGGEVGGHDAGEHGFFVELDVVEGLEGEREVAQQAVHPQQADDGEVAEHAVEGPGTVVAGDGVGVLVAFHGEELLIDLGALDEGVEDVEDGVAAPGIGVLAE